jgi:multiple sugar transport system permease protein
MAATATATGRAGRAGGGALHWVAQGLAYAAVLLGGAVVAVPLYWMFSSALKSSPEILAVPIRWLPSQPRFYNFRDAWASAPFAHYLFNSLFVGGAVTVLTVVFGALTGYGLAKFEFPGRDICFAFILSTMMIPFSVIIIPLFVLVRDLGWMNSYYALIVPGAISAFGVFLMRQFISTLPNELLDAARIDGASEPAIFRIIVLPLTKPALATLALLTFMASWDNFLWPLVVTSGDKFRTLPVGLASFQTQYGTHYEWIMAMATLVTVPVFVLFLGLQRYFVQGIVMSGLKG